MNGGSPPGHAVRSIPASDASAVQSGARRYAAHGQPVREAAGPSTPRKRAAASRASAAPGPGVSARTAIARTAVLARTRMHLLGEEEVRVGWGGCGGEGGGV